MVQTLDTEGSGGKPVAIERHGESLGVLKNMGGCLSTCEDGECPGPRWTLTIGFVWADCKL